ncbi:D-methionine transport system permease protein MetI [Treponema primitia ZAS-2]|uniref:D-methionine transport system permease protein MetI n=1 Tax=Treponema primitia (strain ATCC BAA-887 / DSM 12427 / ZAS-2) TaxID=545694 RepID=F5YHX3_TREPZ|nr:methionine ABC transporter permease [Treponema primitia]AEF86174.1 D-methionine transport system permease protein MetI [Treponema primitia ZAS-2]
MKDILIKIMPNVYELYKSVFNSIWETFIMVLISGAFGIVIGTLLGIILVVSSEGNLYANKILNGVLGRIINAVRSIPFIIIIALLVSFTRWIVGTSIGIRGAIVPMIVGIIPFVSRITEQALLEVDNGVIEAARSMGLSRFFIVRRVLLPEALPGLVRSIITSFISLIGLSAMAGTVGGGGIGAFAIRYGYQRYMHDITLLMVIILLLIVNFVQGFGNKFAKKVSH